MSKLGDRLRELYLAKRAQQGSVSEPDAWSCIAEAFANEVRHDAIPWAHKALDEVGAPKGPDIARRIRELVNVSSRRSLELNAHAEELARKRDQAVTLLASAASPLRLTENALNACKAFDAPTDPSEAVVYLATLLDERDAVREELRAIIVEAINGRGEGK